MPEKKPDQNGKVALWDIDPKTHLPRKYFVPKDKVESEMFNNTYASYTELEVVEICIAGVENIAAEASHSLRVLRRRLMDIKEYMYEMRVPDDA